MAFICAGIPPLIGASLMCFIYRSNSSKSKDAVIEENNEVNAENRENGSVNNPIIKIYTPNGHTQNNTPTRSCENSTNSKVYPNPSDVTNSELARNEKQPLSDDTDGKVSETKPLMKSN